MREPESVLSMVQRVRVISREAVLEDVATSLEALVRRYLSLDGVTEEDEKDLGDLLRGHLETLDLITEKHPTGGEKAKLIRQANRHCRELIEAKFPPIIRDTFPAPKEADQ